MRLKNPPIEMKDPINDLSIVITSAGIYETRDGRLVRVNKVLAEKGQDVTAFIARGTILSAEGRRPYYDLWHLSGRISIFTEDSLDIVKRIC